MSLHTLVPNKDGLLPDFKMVGDFHAMMYFCPDIRFNYKVKNSQSTHAEKSKEELISELDNYLSRLSTISYTWLGENKIKDYWLVITPLLCDQIKKFNKNITLPRSNNNYIVTPFYLHEVEFIKSLYKSLDHVYGTVELHPDPRRRRGTEAQIGFYVACEVNPESHIDFSEIEYLERNSEEYKRKLNVILFKLQLELGTEATYSLNDQIRSFMQYGEDRFGIRFVEQYFNCKASKKINGYPLGEGYIRNRLAKINLGKNEKYSVFHDLFASTGYQFADYALSKEELKLELESFENKPWVITELDPGLANQKPLIMDKGTKKIFVSDSPIFSKIQEQESIGIIFQVEYVVELFKAPLMCSDSHGQSLRTASDLFRNSIHEEFNKLFLSKSEVIYGVSNEQSFAFERNDFLRWQLERLSSETLYHIAAKTEAQIAASCNTNYQPSEKLIYFFDEIVKDPDFSPDEWLNENVQDNEIRGKGFNLISRLRREKPNEFYKLMIDAILDVNTGLLNWLETEVKDNLVSVSESYAHWLVPLIVVSQGVFLPYITPNSPNKIKLDDMQLLRMHIRNYDEDEKA